jgi:hypothetical protein
MRITLVAVALACAVAGCGTSGTQADQARGTVNAFLLNCERGAGALAQESLVAPAREVFVDETGTSSGCARVLQIADPGPEPIDAHVTAVDVDSSRATADVETPSGTRTISLSRGREGWLIEGPLS